MISATDQMQGAFLEALLKGNHLQSSSIALSMANNPDPTDPTDPTDQTHTH